MNFRSLSLQSAFCLCLSVANTGHAQDNFGIAFRGTSNYVYRGYTRSDGGPAGQLNLDYAHSSGVYLGTWLSSVDFTETNRREAEYRRYQAAEGEIYAENLLETWNNSLPSFEFQPYVGFSWALNDTLKLDTQLSGYIYDGKIQGLDYDYGEVYARLHYLDTWSLRVGVAPYAYGYPKTDFNADIQWRFPLNDVWEVTAGVGGESVTAVPGYAQLYWNFGVQWALGKHLSVDLRYHGRYAILTEDSHTQAYGVPRAPLGYPLVASVSIAF